LSALTMLLSQAQDQPQFDNQVAPPFCE